MVLPPILIKDLGLDVPFINGQVKKVKNCWHFSTDGNAVDIMFSDEADFKAGMNTLSTTSSREHLCISLPVTVSDIAWRVSLSTIRKWTPKTISRRSSAML